MNTQEEADLIAARGYIGDDNTPVVMEAVQDPDPEAVEEEEVEEEVEATDAAEKLATELGVDLTEVVGTGAEGRILVSDVQAVADAAAKEEE